MVFLDVLVLVTVVFCCFKLNVSACKPGQNGYHSSGTHAPLRYSSEAILLLRDSVTHKPPYLDTFPTEIISEHNHNNTTTHNKPCRRRPGHRGGVQRRMRKNKTLLPLPSIIMANTRSLRPKSPNYNFDELCTFTSYMREFRQACVMCFSETWFDNKITDDSISIDGFGVPLRCDRDLSASGKKGGGGVCVYVNERYCSRSNVTVRKTLSTPHVDLISLSLRPKYLPREFGQVFITVIYSHPKANLETAATEIADSVRALQAISPDAPNFVLGDFNSCDLRTTLPSFKQYVTCSTRLDGKPDRCYGNIRNAYKSTKLPKIGSTDHDTVHLIPSYLPQIKTNPVMSKTVKIWSNDSIETLKACYECTDWSVFLDNSSDVSEAATVISDYITFCENMIVPEKTVKIFPNNKPWVTKALKQTINEKKVAFQSGDRGERKRVQIKLRGEIREAKKRYKEKVEKNFESGNMREAWVGLKQLTGQNKPKSSECSVTFEEREKFANQLNEFYCRFEREDLRKERERVVEEIRVREREGRQSRDCEVNSAEVQSLFSKLNIRKAMGPDGICGRVLRLCSEQLCDIFSKLFTWSLQTSTVPGVWKNSTICPVPKSKSPSTLNDYRPVALTSIAMKTFERIVLKKLLSQTRDAHDQFQFAYKQNRSTDDATLTLLNNAYTHLENKDSFVRILFIDFSSAFNTIQPHLLSQKLLSLEVNPSIILWISDFLTNRSQSVLYQQALSSSRSTSTGSPQGTVLSPVLFTLYTNDCSGSESTPIIKYSDDTALQDLSNSDSVYFEEVHRFTKWCKDNFLDLNVKKTKEMIIDFRRNPSKISDLFIDDSKVERVDEYKYLGTVLDSKLSFNSNTDAIHKKCQSRMYCLQKLRSLGVCKDVLGNFYRCFLESVLTFGFICWFGGLSVKNVNVLNRVVNVCGKIVGVKQKSLEVLYDERIVSKGRVIGNDASHVLAHHFELLPSGRRFRVQKMTTVRRKNSFIPRAIIALNK